MVFLNRIYTRSGDDGDTALGNGDRVPKTHPRVTAYGSIDELNSVLGVALAVELPPESRQRLLLIQNDLFDLGGDLCIPETDPPTEPSPLRVTAAQVTRLEHWIDDVNDRLRPLESFILPGGSPAAAHIHHARAVCRRVETNVVALANAEPINPQIAIYLNRLSDLLFVMARDCNAQGTEDRLWEPGRNT